MKKPQSAVLAVTLLIGVYVALQLVADVAAAKIVTLAGITMPAGTFVFALTFTWRDLIHKRLGKAWAQGAIIVAAVANIFMALYFWFAISLPPAGFWPLQESFANVLSYVPRITFASIIAELVSELLDTEVYHRMVDRIPERHQWARVLVSNMASIPIDSLVFATLAWAGVRSFDVLIALAAGQILFKGAVTLISMPLIYLVKPANGEMQLSYGGSGRYPASAGADK